eukprot:9858173-Heterocapsa_arctica.AAC.1
MFGGVVIELNRKGERRRRDKAGKLYPIDAYGTKIVRGETSRPPDLTSHLWWKVFTPNDRAKWWADHKADKPREANAIIGDTAAPNALVPAPDTPIPENPFPFEERAAEVLE